MGPIIVGGQSMHHTCTKCGMKTSTCHPNTDYTTDANACVELMAGNSWLISFSSVGFFIFATTGECLADRAPTFCLAICKAYLKYKGIELED